MICILVVLGPLAILCATVVALAIIEADERRDARAVPLAVATWADQSGNANDATQAVETLRPDLTTARAVGDKPEARS